MTRVSIPNGAAVRCEVPGCDARFVTASIVALARTQAEAAGWTRAPQSQVIVYGKALGAGRKLVDLCPAHRPRPRMEGARP